MKQKIETEKAPRVIGPYSQAIKIGNTIYCSGQIPLDPQTMQLVSDDFQAQAIQVFTNLKEVCLAANCALNQVVKLTIYLTDLVYFPMVNEVMMNFFTEPFPARTTIEVSGLPKGAMVEVDAIITL